MKVTRIGSSFAAEVTGLSLRKGVDDTAAAAVEEALAVYPVLVFRGERLTEEQHESFAAHFGALVRNDVAESREDKGAMDPRFVDVSNLDGDGNLLPEDATQSIYFRANQFWHTDGSPIQPPLRVTVLSAQDLPADPPVTLYADTRAAWDALPQNRKDELDGLIAVHSIFASRARLGLTITVTSRPSTVLHPLVRTHRRTGRKSLYIGAHAAHIDGWPEDKGKALLEELVEFATQPQFLYTHEWGPHDVVMWDNSSTLHRATEYDRPEPRVLRWASVLEPEPV